MVELGFLWGSLLVHGSATMKLMLLQRSRTIALLCLRCYASFPLSRVTTAMVLLTTKRM
ncbi:hypothetical protein BDQ17DRAFT_1378707 [Cyathus striatus]|nr:hypothetical protein BDQ17DRAFT_1378707 [Cyathus striatus]